MFKIDIKNPNLAKPVWLAYPNLVMGKYFLESSTVDFGPLKTTVNPDLIANLPQPWLDIDWLRVGIIH